MVSESQLLRFTSPSGPAASTALGSANIRTVHHRATIQSHEDHESRQLYGYASYFSSIR